MARSPSGRPSPDDNVRRVAQMLRAAHDMTPQDLGQRIGLSKAQIWDRLRGDKSFNVTEVAAMAELFNVDPGVFILGPEALLGGGATTYEASRQLSPTTTVGPPNRDAGGRKRGVGTDRFTCRTTWLAGVSGYESGQMGLAA
jgi:transcriptional regulator with XRE-family HTH domain